ncbi:MAG: sporulation protein [Pseudomonadales bacterium]
MSFFKKVLSSVGIGSATVDAVLHNSQVTPGELLSGTVEVKGGSTEQQINHIELHLCCNYFSEESYTDDDDNEHTRVIEHTATIAHARVSEGFKLQSEEALSFDFEFQLPSFTPLSLGKSQVWLETDLDIDYALDKSDRDVVHVVPNEAQAAVLDAMTQLGFGLVEVECEQSRQLGGEFVQEFEFKAQGGDFRGRVDEVEMLLVNADHQLEILLEVDRRARGLGGLFAEMLGRDESQMWLHLHHSDLDQAAELLYQAIDDHC